MAKKVQKRCIFQTSCWTDLTLGSKHVENHENSENVFLQGFSEKKPHDFYMKNSFFWEKMQNIICFNETYQDSN